ncbi:MAG: PA2779 family protein, partial [Desulfobacterales bacterium]
MKKIRQAAKPVSLFLTIFMLLMSVPYQSALAAMIGTETMIDIARGQEAREYVNTMLVREDVQATLIAHGIDP